MLEVVFIYAHFLGAFMLAAALFYEWVAFHQEITLDELLVLQKIDALYGLGALMVLVGGLFRLFVEKGISVYVSNPFFHLKMTLFVLIALCSVYPTICFFKWREMTAKGMLPSISERVGKRIVLCVRVQVVLMLILIFSAIVMARGGVL